MPTDSEVLIEIRNLGKSFGDHEVLKDISLDVHKGYWRSPRPGQSSSRVWRSLDW